MTAGSTFASAPDDAAVATSPQQRFELELVHDKVRRRIPARYRLAGMCSLAAFFAYAQRNGLALAIVRMQSENGWDREVQGRVLACFFFGLSATTRSTGILLSIFVAFYLGNAILIRCCDRLGSALSKIAVALICVVIMFTPYVIISVARPYVLHCDSRVNDTGVDYKAEWCYSAIPSVYTYI